MIDRPADYDPPAWHRVCSRHFLGGKMDGENCVPELFPKNNFKQPLKGRPDSSIQKRKTLIPVKPSTSRRRKLDLNTVSVDGGMCQS